MPNFYKKIIYVILIFVFLSVISYFINNFSAPKTNGAEEKIFTIDKGSGVNEIAKKLFDQGLIRSSFVFKTYVFLTGDRSKLMAGEHKLNSSMNLKKLVSALVSGENINFERTITIIEGWNNAQIAEYLEKEGIVKAEEFISAVKNFKDVNQYDFLKDKPVSVDIEGFLFPDTYRIYKNATADDIVKKMLDNFDRKLSSDLRTAIKGQGKTIFDIITLASIVEKEVASNEDRELVSDIFYRRLEMGMPLQSDATVNYFTGKKDVRPSLEDTKADSPYNTYQHKGLPPGPICNPGLSAINAVINPQPNVFYYFLTTKDGRVIYSKTNEEHAINKKMYLD